eukprot:Gb_40768 [translate_table: standard]
MHITRICPCLPGLCKTTKPTKPLSSPTITTVSATREGKPTQKLNGKSQANNSPHAITARFNALDVKSLREGRQTHAHILITGLHQDVFLVTKLLSMYSKCGCLVDARLVFDSIQKPDVFSWNVMIRGYVMHGQWEEALKLYYKMQRTDVQPNNFTFPFVLKACAILSDLQKGKEIHNDIARSGFESDVFVGNALVAMYAKCASLPSARYVFDKMSQRDLVSWNAMIAGYAQNGCFNEALEVLHQMQMEKVNPDVITWNAMIAGYVQNGFGNEALNVFHQMQLADTKVNTVTVASVISACADLVSLQLGKEIHGYLIKSGFQSDLLVGNALIDMYAKCRSIDDAHQVFVNLFEKDVISWNAMIAGYTQNGYCNEAFEIFHQMQLACLKPNLITWNAMISGFTQNGHCDKALKLFNEMQLAGMKPNSITISSILPACVHVADLQQSKEVYDYIMKNGFESNVIVRSALVDMYAKCGNMESARQLFDRIGQRDVVSWTTMIAACTQNGHGEEALKLFQQMQLAGAKANSVTIASVLPACALLGTLQQGKEIHDYIIRKEFESNVFVGNALIDMYAKCGSIDDARRLFDKMSQRDVVSWNAMIAGYGMHGYGEDALALFHKMQQAVMEPNEITFIAVLSACSHSGLVDEGWQFFNLMSQDYCITPRVEHYACMVDLLGRTGNLDEAWNLIKQMPLEPNANVWGTLLGACRIHCNIDVGERVANCLFELEPKNTGYYVLLSNMYAMAGRWDGVAKVRVMMKERGLKKLPGCSWIVVKNKVHAFTSGDR